MILPRLIKELKDILSKTERMISRRHIINDNSFTFPAAYLIIFAISAELILLPIKKILSVVETRRPVPRVEETTLFSFPVKS